MFLDVTQRRNPAIIEAGISLHQEGIIPPNTYVIDLDVVAHNVQALSSCAREYDLQLYFMTKQLGRIPALAQWIAENGIEKAVAVDWDEARVLHEAGIAVGHVGHLVQPGKHQWLDTLKMKPEYVTVFSEERARQLSEAAVRLGVKQPVLLRVLRPDDHLYPGQEGGFLLSDLPDILPRLDLLPGIRIEGVTSFPALLINDEQTLQMTSNLQTLLMAKEKMEAMGMEVKQVNAPSATSCYTIPQLKQAGVTQGEPGHALTGTTPLHAVQDLTELPGMIYVTEISHEDTDHAYVIGGGFYGRGNIEGAYVASDQRGGSGQFMEHTDLHPSYIDYYGSLKKNDQISVKVGDTAIYAFRTQIFVTRAHVALVRGIQNGRPELVHLQRRW